jgi:hypothetical protein
MYPLVPWIVGERLARLASGLELKSVFQVRPPSTLLLSFSAQLIEPPGTESADLKLATPLLKDDEWGPTSQHRCLAHRHLEH